VNLIYIYLKKSYNIMKHLKRMNLKKMNEEYVPTSSVFTLNGKYEINEVIEALYDITEHISDTKINIFGIDSDFIKRDLEHMIWMVEDWLEQGFTHIIGNYDDWSPEVN